MLSFLVFCFTEKQYIKTPMKVSIKVQRIVGTLSRMRSRVSINLSVFFLENIIFVTFIHIYRKYYISMYFLRKIIFHFSTKEKIYFPDNIREIIFKRDFFFGKTIFLGHLKKISYFHVFFEKDHLHFPSKE